LKRVGFHRLRVSLAGATYALLLLCSLAGAQTPFFWDAHRRVERPDLGALRVIRFVVDDAYPPFGFTAADGSLAGFNVDLARAICDELKLACTVQARRFDTILGAIEQGLSDAAIASIAITPQTRARVDFTAPYYRTPARFAALREQSGGEASPAAFAGKSVGVQEHSAHEAYLRAFFASAVIKTYPTATALREALKKREVNVIFGDGVSLSVWLNSADSSNCCGFLGGPFTESRYFGEGVGVAVRKDSLILRRAIDYALSQLAQRGVYGDIYLKYFPLGFY
jgi:polar amino acid transport system substrate-binding protein